MYSSLNICYDNNKENLFNNRVFLDADHFLYSKIRSCFDCALLWLLCFAVIGSENSRLFLDRSDQKTSPITDCSVTRSILTTLLFDSLVP